ncbi:MAG: hypothetical protein EXQ81_10495 [Thermoleophilia bacterium]|nr:hypothetical protein [Thermoleophilia bacterium]
MKPMIAFLIAVVTAATVSIIPSTAPGAPGFGNGGRASGTSDRLVKPFRSSRVGANFGKQTSSLGAIAKAEKQTRQGAANARSLGFDVQAGRVRVVVEVASSVGAARTTIAAAGGEVEATHARLVQALVPPSAIESIAGSAAVAYVRAPHRPIEQAVLGEEVAGSNASVFQTAGWNGSGVKVAIIDTGFAGLAARQAANDLPAGLTTVDFCGGAFSTASEHGTAVAEIVHETAPQAQLYLICMNSEVTLGQAEAYAKTNGITIVNMSIGWLNTARGDGNGAAGTPDAIVADARANGILWVNAAGNAALTHWSGTFSDTDGDDVHNFTPTDEGNTIFLGAGQQTCAFLKWDNWPASAQDFDLYLVNSTSSTIAAGSENFQDGSQPPLEELCYTNSGVAGNFFIAIVRFAATSTPRFDLFTLSPLEYAVAAGSVTEPASSPNAMAVGALCWADASLRPYSSLGPTIDGRTKPDIVGLDGVSGGTYGLPSGCSGGFTGTSASSPHVAGLAALGKQQNPSLTPAQLQRWLEARAQDVATAGKDNFTGAGRAFVYTFTDSPPATPLHLYIEQLFKKGTTTGCSQLDAVTGLRSYCPNQLVTRRDMAVFIIRSLNLSELLSPTPTFADVPADMFGYGFVERFYAQGITTGCSASPLNFCPLDTITRRDMAVFIVRSKNLTQLLSPTPTFSDVPADMFGYGHGERFFEQGITTGCAAAPLRFCPLDFVDRKATAAFLIRAFGT